MTYFHALILGIIEGLTEFLPISSTGHLILASQLLHLPNTDFQKSFEVIIQLGAIMAVVVLYFNQLLKSTKLWPKLFFSFLPTAVIGFTLYPLIKNYLLGNSSITIISLLVGGIILLFIDRFTPKKNISLNDLSIWKLFQIGFFQSISMIPGVSRSAASIIGAQTTGLNKINATEFSFLLAVPTMIAATGLDLIKSNFQFSSYEYQLLAIGLITSFITAVIAIKGFLSFVKNHSFFSFGVYRIVTALLFYLLLGSRF